MMSIDAQGIGAVALTVVSAVYDASERRIPNWLTAGGAVVGAGLCLVVSAGWIANPAPVDAVTGLATMAITLLAMILLYSMGVFGGGDAKLFAALGPWVGFPGILEIFLYTIVASVLMGLAVCAARGKTLSFLGAAMLTLGSIAAPSLRQRVDPSVTRIRLPLGVAAFFATGLWFTLRTMHLRA